MSDMVICDHVNKCNSKLCFHGRPHIIENQSCKHGCVHFTEAKCVVYVKPPRKRSAPLYNELLDERELLKIENHNLKVQLDTVKNATLFGVLTWWFGNRKVEWK